MIMLFIAVAAAGLALVLYQPITKNRTHQMLAQGTSVALLAIGLFGGLIQIIAR
jgi:hypothetical protein